MNQTAQHASKLLCENANSTLNTVLFEQYGVACADKKLKEVDYLENILDVDLAKANFKCCQNEK